MKGRKVVSNTRMVDKEELKQVGYENERESSSGLYAMRTLGSEARVTDRLGMWLTDNPARSRGRVGLCLARDNC